MPISSVAVRECWQLLFDHPSHRQRARVDVQLLHQALESSWFKYDGAMAGLLAYRQRVLAFLFLNLCSA